MNDLRGIEMYGCSGEYSVIKTTRNTMLSSFGIIRRIQNRLTKNS